MGKKQSDIWAPLSQELEQWAGNECVAQLWLRDDDAIEVTPALHRLDELCASHEVPYTIASIPNLVTAELAQWAKTRGLGAYCVHGFSHTNHAPVGEKKCELGLHRGPEIIIDELESGHQQLSKMFGEQFVSLLVPPWNRIDHALIPHLSKIGFKALSTYGWPKTQASHDIKILNTHVDIIDWKGTRGGLPIDQLVFDLVKAMQDARVIDAINPPAIGILSHHLVHNELAWKFLDELMAFCAANDQIIWKSARDLASL